MDWENRTASELLKDATSDWGRLTKQFFNCTSLTSAVLGAMMVKKLIFQLYIIRGGVHSSPDFEQQATQDLVKSFEALHRGRGTGTIVL